MSGCAEQTPERIKDILEALDNGRTRDDLVQQYGMKNRASLDQYMRRHHYVFNAYLQTYNKTPDHPAYSEFEEPSLPYKVTQILLEFRSVAADPREIAARLGFKDHKELATYMREQGFEWNSDIHNYRRAGSQPNKQPTGGEQDISSSVIPANTVLPQLDWGDYLPLLKLLQDNRDKLITLLEQTPPRILTIPRYALRGKHVIKTVNISSGLEELIREFTREKNLSQREVFEVALIQFLFRYGFGKRIEQLL